MFLEILKSRDNSGGPKSGSFPPAGACCSANKNRLLCMMENSFIHSSDSVMIPRFIREKGDRECSLLMSCTDILEDMGDQIGPPCSILYCTRLRDLFAILYS